MEQALVVLTNLPDQAQADSLATFLVESRLAACVNALPVVSTYRWEGKMERAQEVSLIIKTSSARYPELEQAIKSRHPYDLPEIIAFELVQGLPAYLQWINSETRKEQNV